MIPTCQPKGARAAFSLLEVLVAAGVLAIVMVVMLGALSTSLSLWRNTDNKIVADREARAVESLLVRDLAGVVMPSSPGLWPRLATNAGSFYLKFLTTAPSEAQSVAGTEPGDVCYVEYAVVPSTNGPGREVRRLFWPSERTFTEVIRKGAFPANPQGAADYQALGLNLLTTNRMAARGLGPLAGEANNTNFVLINTNMLPLTGAMTVNNYPAAVEVNFAVADPTTLGNTDVIARTNYILRSAGLYSFRVRLPKPLSAP